MSDIQLVDAPAGVEGSGFFATRLDKAVGLARSHSLWPLPFATSCCGIEFMATMGANYDIARFGSERPSFSPRQADLLMVMGTIAKKMGPVLRQVYLQMAEPRWVMAVGACASSGGIF
ncbi:MAG: NADH-quinone oxidoreductase subunit NuoB, partial [Solitalea sp.]